MLGSKQLLLRGAFLRNTEWIIGMVVYTGLDTKIMRNAEASKIKQSDVEKKMNGYILNILYTQLILALFTSLLCLAWAFRNFSDE
jgi:magnesium-transporting ATPase (P-type)